MHKHLLPFFMLIFLATFSHADWIPLEEVPSYVDTGGAIVYGGYGDYPNGSYYVWCIVGGRTDEFFVYDILAGSWEEELEPVPEEIDSAAAIAYDTRQSRRVFVAVNTEYENWDQLFVYTQYLPTSWEGEWNVTEEVVNRIFLPDSQCGPGVALAFQPVSNPPTIAGWLYLFKGGGSTEFYRIVVPYISDYPLGFYPPEDSQISRNSLVFDWEFVNEAIQYQFQLAQTSAFDYLIFDTIVTESEFNPPAEILENGVYYWRVRFKRNLKRFEWSDWSHSMRFMLDNTGRPRIVYSYPPDKSILATNRLAIDWAPVGRIVRYQVQIDNDSSFLTPVIDTLIDNSELTIQLANGRYWWHARFMSDGGQWSQWSRTSSFELHEGWQRLTDIPVEVNAGGAMCYHRQSGQESIYALVGGGDTRFYCYSINLNTWTSKAPSDSNQNDGSSIVSAYQSSQQGDESDLYAIFGKGNGIKNYFLYRVDQNLWYYTHDPLPAILGFGASLAYDPRCDHAYLVIGGERDGFYVNEYPGFTKEKEGSQSQEAIPVSQKSKISSYPDRLIIHYSTDAPANVKIQVYDLLGKRVETLISKKVEKGEHQVTWDKTDNSNRKVACGIYFIEINKENRTERLKVTIR